MLKNLAVKISTNKYIKIIFRIALTLFLIIVLLLTALAIYFLIADHIYNNS